MKREKEKLSKGAASGMVALVFLVLGFQLAIFVVKVVERPPRAEDARSEPGMTEKSAAGMTERSAVDMAGGSSSGMTERSAPGVGPELGWTAGSELGRTEQPGVAGKSGSGSDGDADLLGQSKSEVDGDAGLLGQSKSAVDGDADLSGRSKLGGYARPAGVTRASGVKKPGRTWPSDAKKPGRTWPSDAKKPGRTYESFAFDPNTVSVADLQRLGLSERQAESIENYRSKGGRFRSKEDFRKMYVVSDTLFARLEAYIDIPKLELNRADSAALVALRGIGPYYARKILDYRERLGGFVDAAQLLEIEGIDADRLAGFSEDVTVDAKKIRKIDLWHASDTVLARHPYIGAKGARSVLRYRQLYDSARWTLPDLAKERALPPENIEKLKKYIEIQ
jgi:DNA uptake protein ComE-like DNA-binding protein